MSLTIALGQAESVPGDLAANLATATRLVAEAAARGARVLALPELFACGYDPAAVLADPVGRSLTPPPPGTAPPPLSPLAPLAAAAASHGLWVLLGCSVRGEDTGGRPYNAVLVIDPYGTVRGHYAKTHLWQEERAPFAPGDRLMVIEDGGVTLGLGICYDAGFPELTRAYARAGAHAVLFCSAFANGPTEYRYGVYHPARAVENTVSTLVVNAVGDLAGEHYFGRSGVWNPEGRQVAGCPDDVGALCVATVSAAETAAVRQGLSYLTDLRTDLLGDAPVPPLTRITLTTTSPATTTNPATIAASAATPGAIHAPRLSRS
ncbi:carbon-nitrogen hydrolase family protein [Streptomyces sp. NPDC093109]|uniref:carbon-nitrogen hydrolase family protein n=1 Tax=Streptomyces sp. NPDC093109 TaxID=3154977 RepID=UPI00344C80E9